MKKYRVYFNFRSNAGVDVEAKDEDEAWKKATDIIFDAELSKEILNNLEVEGVDTIDEL